MKFAHITIARGPVEAFNELRDEALYLYGHGRKTDSIGDKENFDMLAKLESRYLDKLDTYWLRAEGWYRSTRKNKRKYPKGIPVSVAPHFVRGIEGYLDPNGPAMCFEITGARVPQIKESLDMKGQWGRAYWFGGTV